MRLSSDRARLSNPKRSRRSPVPIVVDDPPHRRRHFTVRPLPFVLAMLLAWVLWASTTDGGVSARGRDIVDAVRNMLSDATTDPGLKRAANYYNTQYETQRSYPHLGEVDQAGAGLGVSVVWCNSNAIVLRGFSGSGTTSRLLLAGEDLGDVRGAVDCPVDFANPEPWSLPDL